MGRARIRLKTTANPFSWFETLVDSRKVGGFWDDGLFRNMLMLIVGDVGLLHLGLYGSGARGIQTVSTLVWGLFFANRSLMRFISCSIFAVDCAGLILVFRHSLRPPAW